MRKYLSAFALALFVTVGFSSCQDDAADIVPDSTSIDVDDVETGQIKNTSAKKISGKSIEGSN